MNPLLSVADALHLVCQHAQRRPTVELELGSSLLGLVLAEDVAADLDVPPFDKSMMDGFAVRHDDLAAGQAVLSIVEEITAGRTPAKEIGAGQTARIMTGAVMPPGADAVVMVERSTLLNEQQVRLEDHPKAGQNVLSRAKEMHTGEVVLSRGTVLRPQELGVLATVGQATVPVYRPPVVALLSTGDEIVEPGEKPGPGQIRNSNATLLAGLTVRARGEPRYLGIAADTLDSLHSHVRQGLQVDVLLLSGGVSMGNLDLVPQVLQEEGVQPVFHKVAMKPGKPLFFGTKGTTLVFGLPGNPVSSFIGFELFVRPALRLLQGRTDAHPSLLRARLAVAHQHKSDRPTYHPCQAELRADGWWLTPIPWLGSADLRALTSAHMFAILPAGQHQFTAGEWVDALAPELDL